MDSCFGIWPSLIKSRNRDLIEALSESEDPASAGTVKRLRRHWSAETIRAAVSMVLVRRKAVGKMRQPDLLLADPSGLEQSTGSVVANHKANRFKKAGIQRAYDLCCGIGGDAMALSEVTDLTVVDRDPERVWLAKCNVSLTTEAATHGVVADLEQMPLSDMPFHLDPARRSAEGRRRHRFEDASPGPDVIFRLIERAVDCAIKLSPGVAFEPLPDGEVEIINSGGTLVQAVLWTGRLSQGSGLRTATHLPGGTSLTGLPDRPMRFSVPERYLLAVNPAVERAGLMGLLGEQLNLPAVHPALGLLTAAHAVPSSWLTPYELIEAMAWREKKVTAWLSDNEAGTVVVKTRDKTVDPDVISRRLSGTGDGHFTVFILRLDKKVVAWITRRVA